MKIEWRPIPNYEGFYDVSSTGSVRGIDRILPDGRQWKGIVLRIKTAKSGHMSVRLCGRDGIHRWVGVHRLVLEAFVGPCPDGMEGAHNDGVPSHNWPSNLRWDTRSGNHADKHAHGTLLVGTKNHLAKLTEDQVRSIFRLHVTGVTGRQIARLMNVTPANISSILRGKTWQHLRIQ